MKNINWENLREFLVNRSDSCFESCYEEDLSSKIPESWRKIGTLEDENTNPYGSLSHKMWEKYAIGFYPFNMCDIYIDDTDRVLLSYIELSGHFPFRRSFIATKDSPFIWEPISCCIIIDLQNEVHFIDYLSKYGISQTKIDNQINFFNTIISQEISLPGIPKYTLEKKQIELFDFDEDEVYVPDVHKTESDIYFKIVARRDKITDIIQFAKRLNQK